MIALITDFGHFDNYAGILKGVIKGISPEAEIIDVTHSVESFSILNAQYNLHTSYRYFPSGTIFCVVVDPGVGSDRKGLIARCSNYTFVLPDNGILSAVEEDDMEIFEIDTSRFDNLSTTFHGRDLFAPVASRLFNGASPLSMGSKTEIAVGSRFPVFDIRSGNISCTVLHIDRYGNVITSVPNRYISDIVSSRFIIKTGYNEFTAERCFTYSDLKSTMPGLLEGSSGFLELCENMNSISENNEIFIEDRLVINYAF